MKLISIDVGIKNLAFCLFDNSNISNSNNNSSNEFRIIKWDVIDLTNNSNYKCCFSETIKKSKKNAILNSNQNISLDNELKCSKQASYKKDNDFFCTKHAKKHDKFIIPTSQQKRENINKLKLQKLQEYYTNLINLATNNNNININKYSNISLNKIKKPELISLILEIINIIYFEPIEKTKASDVLLYNIGINIKNKFNEYLNEINDIDYVIIENQIGPLAIRMKTIQGMILQYFIMSNYNIKNIEFINATNKLKDFNINEKLKYCERKKMSITKCLELLTTDFRFNNYIDFFNSNNKKDDLSDAFLQGYWYINNKF